MIDHVNEELGTTAAAITHNAPIVAMGRHARPVSRSPMAFASDDVAVPDLQTRKRMKTKTQAKQTAARRPLTIGELMTATPNTIGSDQTLSKAHAVMREQDVRHLPVLDAGKIVGILSQRDLYFLEAIAGVDIQIDQVADAMTPDVYTTEPGASVRDVARVMAEHKYGCAVVVDGRHVVGIFTATDALRHLADALPG